MKADNPIQSKSMAYAVRICSLAKELRRMGEYDIARQVLRSGTAVGALVREAEYAESTPDFIHKMRIALKEANETAYWLELIWRTSMLPDSVFSELKGGVEELKIILIRIINTSLKNSDIK